jgi:nucleotide-binding universal stress UspA family protein
MSEKNILVPVDLTETSRTAATCAAKIARVSGGKMTLLHIQNGESTTEDAIALTSMANSLRSEFSVACDYLIREGKIFSEISNEAGEPMYGFMVIGSHGFKGIKEKLLGADILKLVKNIPIPVLVIQKDHSLPAEGIKTIVFPAGSHESFQNQINATILMAGLFGSEVHVYTIEKPGFPWSDALKANIEKTIHDFESNNIRYKRVNETQNTFSPGYAKQTLQYAGKMNADLISVMSVPTNEFYYIADSDKERLLTNEMNIPVLCSSDKKRV